MSAFTTMPGNNGVQMASEWLKLHRPKSVFMMHSKQAASKSKWVGLLWVARVRYLTPCFWQRDSKSLFPSHSSERLCNLPHHVCLSLRCLQPILKPAYIPPWCNSAESLLNIGPPRFMRAHTTHRSPLSFSLLNSFSLVLTFTVTFSTAAGMGHWKSITARSPLMRFKLWRVCRKLASLIPLRQQ